MAGKREMCGMSEIAETNGMPGIHGTRGMTEIAVLPGKLGIMEFQ